MPELLALERVSRRFGGLRAVNEVSFTVARGQIVGLIGPNGAGKTTLFNLLVGLTRPTGGRIRLAGHDITGWRPHRIVRLGMTKTFQSVALFAEMTVLENVLTGALLRHPVGRAESLARTNLERVGLAHIAAKSAGDLSFPERARVELARALCTEPKVLLLDEVMAALNRTEMNELMQLVRRLRDEGLTFIVVEHHMHAIMALCERIVVVNFGEKIAEGTPDQIAHDPAVIEAYLGSAYGAQGAAH